MTDKTSSVPNGIIDRSGQGIDPTKNVLDLVTAAVNREDDLREMESKHLREIIELRARAQDQIADLRAAHSEELREAEAKRIDAIRAVDVSAVAAAANQATQSANVLAAEVARTAETLRTLVTSTAANQATSQQQIDKAITDRLSLVERAQYEGAGKERVTDPQIAQMLAEVRALTTTLAEGTGSKQGATENRAQAVDTTRLTLAIIAGVFGFISIVATVIGSVVLITR